MPTIIPNYNKTDSAVWVLMLKDREADLMTVSF
jgi:hypothetical protein